MTILPSRTLQLRRLGFAIAACPLILGLACKSSDSNSSPSPTVAVRGTVELLVTDEPTSEWAEVGVIIRKAALIPAGGKEENAQVFYDGNTSTQKLNLVDLNELSEWIGAGEIKTGTYDRLLIWVDGDPAKISLIPAPDESGNAKSAIPADQIKVVGADPTTHWVKIPISLTSPVIVEDSVTSAVQVDFQLNHPTFLVSVELPAPVGSFHILKFAAEQKAKSLMSQIRLRHIAGEVGAIAGDRGSFTLKALSGATRTLKVGANAQFCDLDVSPLSFQASATLPLAIGAGKQILAAGRFGDDGSLTAQQVWFSQDVAKLSANLPEGHVWKVDGTQFQVVTRKGLRTFTVDGSTQFTFLNGTQLGVGSNYVNHLLRRFKVQVLANGAQEPALAQRVTIQRASVGGQFISPTNDQQLSYAKAWGEGVSEQKSFAYADGFSWWNFGSTSPASTDKAAFVAKAMPVSGTLKPRGVTDLEFGYTATWEAKNAVFLPITPSVVQMVSSPFKDGSMQIAHGALPNLSFVAVNLKVGGDFTTQVTEFKQTEGVVTATAVDAAKWAEKLTVNTLVKIYGTPNANGSLDATTVAILNFQ